MAQELKTKKTDSVFDFLYVDHHRIGLFLSQFSEYGNLTDIVHSKAVTDHASVSGGIKGLISGESKSGATESLQSSYNTQWSQALNFLDEVNARGMLARDIAAARIGGLVLTSGTLSMLNMKALDRSWEAAAENAREQHQRSQSSFGNRKARRAAQATVTETPPESDWAGLRLLGSLEQPIVMALALKNGKARLWSTLQPNYLIGGSSDLTLKQGVRIAGDWHVLSILDCLPGELDTDEAAIGRICGGGDNIFSSGAITIWRELGLVFGRPSDCHGVTPIMIMREVKN